MQRRAAARVGPANPWEAGAAMRATEPATLIRRAGGNGQPRTAVTGDYEYHVRHDCLITDLVRQPIVEAAAFERLLELTCGLKVPRDGHPRQVNPFTDDELDELLPALATFQRRLGIPPTDAGKVYGIEPCSTES